MLEVTGAGAAEVNGFYKRHPDGDYAGKARYQHCSDDTIKRTPATPPPYRLPFSPAFCTRVLPAPHPRNTHASGAAAA